jgi:hypothetical protein
VHWCHGATGKLRPECLLTVATLLPQAGQALLLPCFPPLAGAVFLLCKAHEQLGPSGGYLAAAERSGEAVWQRGLLRKVVCRTPLAA